MGQFQQYVPQATAGVSFLGSLLESSGIRAEGEGSAAAARYNAKLAEQEGYAEEARTRREGMRYLASRAVSASKSGVALEGTPLEALIADAETIERDAISARYQGRDTARLERSAGRAAQSSARRGSAAAIISGLSNAGETYYRLRYPAGIPRPRPARP